MVIAKTLSVIIGSAYFVGSILVLLRKSRIIIIRLVSSDLDDFCALLFLLLRRKAALPGGNELPPLEQGFRCFEY